MAKDSEEVKEAIREKCTPEQIQAWRYFSNTEKDGCMTKWNHVTDAEYDALVESQMARLGLLTPARTITKLGLEPEDVAEFEPICLRDYYPAMSTAKNRYRRGEDKIIRTSNYQVTWLLCSKDQVLYSSAHSL